MIPVSRARPALEAVQSEFQPADCGLLWRTHLRIKLEIGFMVIAMVLKDTRLVRNS